MSKNGEELSNYLDYLITHLIRLSRHVTDKEISDISIIHQHTDEIANNLDILIEKISKVYPIDKINWKDTNTQLVIRDFIIDKIIDKQ